VNENARTIITSNLDSWFRDRSLAQLYTVTDNTTQLTALKDTQQQLASTAIIKLAFISAIPFLGGIVGFILLVSLLIQLLLKKEKAILAANSNLNWQTPWDWEITWQVIIVGFFFVGQFVLPFLLGIVGFNIVEASIRAKAIYVLLTYILMAAGGITVLYLSIKSYLPLSQEWFKVKLIDNWFVWGFGGYLVAIPCVLFISLINQQIWNGQGGSNPLLYLALQAQDKVALAVFFFTASIAAPIFEELIFRGFLLPSLTRYMSVTTAIILSGLLFAVAHLSLAEVLPLATLGIILGVVYTRSRNILAPMLLHSLWNSGTLLSLFVLGSGT
jgi:membrane protease YdiL (CAAX protease family)